MKKTIIWSLALMMGLSLAFSGPIFAEDSTGNENEDAKPVPTLYQENKIKNEENKENKEKKEFKEKTLMNSLEKILTPDQIKNFEKIVRHGNTLYGIRMSSSSTGTESTSTEIKKEDKKFEKIAAPQFIKLYEQIKKVGINLWGLKKGDVKKPEAETMMGKVYVTAETAACAIAAIESKDDSLKTANTYQATMVNEAITARTACQKAVINSHISTSTPVVGQQKENFNSCVKTFKTSLEKVKEAAKKSHVTTWETYKTSLKACHSTTATGTALMIEDGGGSLLGD